MSNIPQENRAWILAKKPNGIPTTSGSDATFKLESRAIPQLKPDQVLVKVLYYSNDPAQRGWISPNIPKERLYVPPVEVGNPMRARGLGEVIESTSDKISKGSIVRGTVDWNQYVVLDASAVQVVGDLPGGLSITHWLGALGSTGLTAHYGLVDIGEAKKGDKIVVSGAAGATGSMVVQIAKNIVGAENVIGIAGTDEKCRWVEKLGADKCLNYKSSTFADDLKEATKSGVDLYFDNVGGEILDAMLARMSLHGRIVACGAITGYNSEDPCILTNYFQVISMRLQIRGFIVIDCPPQKVKEVITLFQEAIKDGRLKIGDENETVVPTSFEDVPQTWLRLFSGQNTGKLVTKLQ